MSDASNAPRDITEDPDHAIVMSDGTRLSARLWRPEDDSEQVPAILEFLPYRKRDGTCPRDALTHPYFARHGYACARVDMRGNGDSEGIMEDEYSQQELDDAVEVIRHLAAQPWCNGNVGMMGISWGGFNSLQVAAMTPPELKAIITLCSTVDRFADDIHYKGGNLLNENLGWGATMWSYSSRAPDPALRENWREMWLERLEAEPFLPSLWLRHQRRDSYWEHGSVCESYDTIKAKVLAVGGWGDSYKNTVPQIVKNIPGSKGIVGPWVHKYPHFAVPEPRIGFLQEALRWWDRWLKGIDTGVEDDPDYRAYVMDGVRPATWYTDRPGRWVTQDGAVAGRETMHEEPVMNRNFWLGDGVLSTDIDVADTTVQSPAHTGADAGEYCAIWLGPEMPGDQRRDDGLSATWTSSPLDSDMDILGAPAIEMMLRSDAPQAQIAVRLCHVHPDGASTRITYGVLNLSHRDSASDPSAMPVGEDQFVTLALDHVGYRVPKGHRLRVSISTAYWPLMWPTPTAAAVHIHRAQLGVPLHEARAQDGSVAFPPPAAAEPWEVEELRPETHVRRQDTDMVTGTTTLVIEDDFGKWRDSDHGLINGSVARERWSIHPDDPLSARGTCHWTDEIERGDIRLRTETYSEMWSDGTTFYLTAKVEAYENDTLIFDKSVEDSIARDHL
ncbi:CocE/NonD family hydrolase [Sulfitobacter pseudonitzschiae]|uniref:CocE/NonD family hydrolase n=1 Tax=Pseudosulfitobacter pseudonitzschiae TaxID=1402135 RepID=A0A9Q2NNI3_9RHOB|nr:CocE/NonD family hydrolase [Pseudosulfitobacter pseudonitzschiae]MBM2293440.1 CocE/NonD family hydrolase [Pseudosulfitobacter pseudonitzschiae]MBM2298254.1 CocE/NonD family hydrolase [Pseudosulfitobacter pseudonitzschiae]MBM2303168.1 CocE/NonD family hydrolase [Pseudosulfitobacter pseudonitzschiae]MBM2312951.1 CocE/NonD family hydrolase [Pseudosulfitobacter pseudonitzschiae]MBM2317864.1 CocE/NonD family hydrolase [Pseudosulfitobacter pseudonitzschiae]